jgi:hypothetical protein
VISLQLDLDHTSSGVTVCNVIISLNLKMDIIIYAGVTGLMTACPRKGFGDAVD